jgi:WD40 repeat protein
MNSLLNKYALLGINLSLIFSLNIAALDNILVLAHNSKDICLTKTQYQDEDLVFSPDSRYLAASWDEEAGIARLWDVESGKVLQTFTNTSPKDRFGFSNHLGRFAFSADGQYIVTGHLNSSFVLLWNVRTGQKLYEIPPDGEEYGEYPPEVSISSDEKYIFVAGPSHSTNEDLRTYKLRIYDFESGKALYRFTSTVFAWDDHHIFMQDDAENSADIIVWDIQANKKVASLNLGQNVYDIVLPGQYMAVVNYEEGSFNYNYSLWNASTYKQIYTLNIGENARFLIVSKNGRYLLIESASGLALWDVASNRQLHLFTNFVAYPAKFTPDSRYVLLGVVNPNNSKGSPVYRMWDIKLNKERKNFQIEGLGNTAQFSPDGKYLATGAHTGELRLWDLITGQELHIDC